MERDVTIREFIDKIKREGIEEGKKLSESIHAEARAQADSIVREAEEKAARLLNKAEEDIRHREEASEKALTQAGRNVVLTVRQEIVHMCERILELRLRDALTPELMKEMILKIVDKWDPQERAHGLEVLLSEKEREKLERCLIKDIQDELKKGVALKPVKWIDAGFRIGVRDGNMHYDFSDMSIAQILTAYLNPRVARILQTSEPEGTHKA